MKTLEQIETDQSTFSIGLALSQGWAYVSKNLVYYILGGIISFLIGAAAGFIPILGSIANSLIITPCLMAGAIYVTWQIANGKAWTDFADMFKGFNFLVPLLVSSLIQGLIVIGLAAIVLFSYIPEIIEIVKLSSGGGAFTNKDEIRDLVLNFISVKTALLISLVAIVSLFISIIWAFKSHFIVIFKLEAWAAMEASRKIAMRNFFQVLGLFLVLGFVIFLSAIPCGVGLFFTLPWMIGATYSAFSQITQSDNAMDITKEGFDFLAEEEESL